VQDAEDTMGGPVKFNRWVYRQLAADGQAAPGNVNAVPIVWAPSVVSAESRELRGDIEELKEELDEAKYEIAELQAEIDAAAKAAGRASADAKLNGGADLTEDNGPFASLFMPIVQPKKKKKRRRRKGQAAPEESDDDKPREQPVLDLFHSMPSVAKKLPPGPPPPEDEDPEKRDLVVVGGGP
jgi:hypothetical protein